MEVQRPLRYLTFCIVNYNGERYLEETLRSVYVQEEKFTEILLIDNASKDKSLEIIKNQFPEVRVIQLKKNFGPASARNEGFKVASSDWILFMDNDVHLSPDFSNGLMEALNENPNAAVAVPQVYFAIQKNKLQYDGADCHFMGLMILHDINHTLTGSSNGIRKIGSLATACFLVDRKKWGKGKLFDDSFFFNYEDHDFGLRTRIKGYEILSVSSSRCYHREGTMGLSLREGGKYSKMRVYCLIRNRWQIILKNYQLRTILLLSPIFFTYEIFQLAGVIKKGWFIEWLKAFLWIIFNSDQILQKRRTIQKLRRTPDREILKGGPIPFFKDLPKGLLEQMGKKLLDFLAGIYWDRVKRLI